MPPDNATAIDELIFDMSLAFDEGKKAGGGVFQVCGIWRCTSAAGAARATSAHGNCSEHDTNRYLSCSRTLGDPELKMNPDRPILSNVPEVEVRKLQPTDLFIVLACDGVWDVLDAEGAAAVLAEAPPNKDPAEARAGGDIAHTSQGTRAKEEEW